MFKMFSAIDNLARKSMEADGVDQLSQQETNIFKIFLLFCYVFKSGLKQVKY